MLFRCKHYYFRYLQNFAAKKKASVFVKNEFSLHLKGQHFREYTAESSIYNINFIIFKITKVFSICWICYLAKRRKSFKRRFSAVNSVLIKEIPILTAPTLVINSAIFFIYKDNFEIFIDAETYFLEITFCIPRFPWNSVVMDKFKASKIGTCSKIGPHFWKLVSIRKYFYKTTIMKETTPSKAKLSWG